MTHPEILQQTPVTMAGLKEELEKIKKSYKEPGLRSQKTEEYFSQFVGLDIKKVAELRAQLEKLNIPRLKDTHIVKIIDLLPKTVDDLKVILQGYALTVSNDNLKKIVEVVKKQA